MFFWEKNGLIAITALSSLILFKKRELAKNAYREWPIIILKDEALYCFLSSGINSSNKKYSFSKASPRSSVFLKWFPNI